jgi:Flp pilus assembly protein TadG
MKLSGIFRKLPENQRGAVIVLMALLLFVLLGIAAFAIDFGYRHVVRNELQNAADAAALAAAREMAKIYQTLGSYAAQQNYVFTPSDIVPIAQEAAFENYAGDVGTLSVAASDVVIGDWDFEADPSSVDPLTATLNQPNAVRVTTRRDVNANGPITTFFASIFNIDTLPVTARATAALSGQSTAEPGEIELPVGISRYWFENNACLDVIAFSPSNDPASCAGWHTFEDDPPNDAKMRQLLETFIETGNSGSPHTNTGQTSFEFIGGELSKNTFEHLMVAFQRNGYDVSGFDADDLGIPITDLSGNPINDATGTGQEVTLCTSTVTGVTRCDAADSTGEFAYYPDDPTTPSVTEHVARNLHAWQTTVPVYDRDDCTNPNQEITIVGFALVEVQDVGGPSDKTIKARVLCDYVQAEDERGGGGNYGTLGSVPGLVE